MGTSCKSLRVTWNLPEILFSFVTSFTRAPRGSEGEEVVPMEDVGGADSRRGGEEGEPRFSLLSLPSF